MLPHDGVVITYRVGDSYEEKTYPSRFGNAAGSARMRHIPPSLLPPPREARSDTISIITKKAILDHTKLYCPESSHQRDVMRRRTGPFTYQEKAALILSDVREAMFADFKEKVL